MIHLRKLENTDKDRVASLLNNKKIWDNLRDYIPYPYTVTDATAFINTTQKEKPTVTFAITLNNELIGVIGLILQTDIYQKSAEIGYWLGEPYWGNGYVTTAIQKMKTYGFEKLGLIRIFAGTFEQNIGSQRALEKAGFKFEGIFKKAIYKNKQVFDEYRYAILNPVMIENSVSS